MANSSVAHDAEKWVVEEFLPGKFSGSVFSGKKLRLKWGGLFNFDAVDSAGNIVGLVSTSHARTAGDNLATAKIQKIKCDTLYLLNVSTASTRMLVFTEKSMHDHIEKEANGGRFPKDVLLVYAPLPDALQKRVLEFRSEASKETSPARK